MRRVISLASALSSNSPRRRPKSRSGMEAEPPLTVGQVALMSVAHSQGRKAQRKTVLGELMVICPLDLSCYYANRVQDPNTAPFPTAAELRARIPATGLKVAELLAFFPGQVVGDERKQRFTKLMRENTRYDKPRKLLLPL